MQETTRDKVTVLPDERESLVDEIAHQLGLTRVGWIFTDLIADNTQKGTVSFCRFQLHSSYIAESITYKINIQCVFTKNFQL